MLLRSDVARSLSVPVGHDVNCDLTINYMNQTNSRSRWSGGKEVGYSDQVTGTRSNQGKVAKTDLKRREQRRFK